ncbi:MAG: glycosidase [Planctomycetota bacterium]|nr:MAG: glycosidase [Planctomycetota bacterium]
MTAKETGVSAHLFERYPNNPILQSNDWPYPVNTVFNAGATAVDGETLLLVRVEDRTGMSHLCAARSSDGIKDWRIDPGPTMPALPDEYPEDLYGIEDPRIVWIDEMESWSITYVSFSHGGPLVSLALTKDFKTFVRLGPVMTPDDKDASLFPHRIEGRWAMIHRPISPGGKAHIWISYSPDMKHWGDHQILLRAREGGWWDANKIGLSPPPLKTKEGWLMLYHGVRDTASGSLYRLGLALLDLEDPRKILRRSDEWIFGPYELYERAGDVHDVVFPCGWILDEPIGRIRLYYGAADTTLALATADIDEVLDYVMRCPKG